MTKQEPILALKKVREKYYELKGCDFSLFFNFNADTENVYILHISSVFNEMHIEYHVAKDKLYTFGNTFDRERITAYKRCIEIATGLPPAGRTCLEFILGKCKEKCIQ